ncbi:MAG: hypothetical protein K9M57_02200 [Phycisphaerae bacterium]|nr:hypothetical protein [Phycisphaerae bacterium]
MAGYEEGKNELQKRTPTPKIDSPIAEPPQNAQNEHQNNYHAILYHNQSNRHFNPKVSTLTIVATGPGKIYTSKERLKISKRPFKMTKTSFKNIYARCLFFY